VDRSATDTVLAGPSGSDKTSLLRLLAGLERPLGGQVWLDGRPLAAHDREGLAALRRRIGYLPQEPSPVSFLSAEENIILALRIRGWEREAAASRAAHALAGVHLYASRRQRPSRLSAGETQRMRSPAPWRRPGAC
jgi:ABC-type methionine transport system ATPase subunit